MKSRLGSLIPYFLLFAFLSSCASVTSFNKSLERPLTVKEMQYDIKKTQKKLFKMHPDLDWYVNLDSLRNSFDILSNSITESMPREEFYWKFAPLIAQVKQGHSLIVLQSSKPTKSQKKYRKGTQAPATLFQTKSENDKYYIVKDMTLDSSLVKGAEILKINGVSPQLLMDKYKTVLTGDGFNTTYFDVVKGRRLLTLYERIYGVQDSLLLDLNNNGVAYQQMIRRIPKATLEQIQKDKDSVLKYKIELVKADTFITDSLKTVQINKLKNSENSDSIFRFAKDLKTDAFLKDLRIVDSQMAILTIRSFSGDLFSSNKNYKKVFKKLHDKKIANLVIDLRGNPGGSLTDIANLQAFLTPHNQYRTIHPVSTTLSRYKMPFWNLVNIPGWARPIMFPFSTAKSLGYLLRTKSNKDGTYTYRAKQSQLKNANEYNFKGKIFLLVDGGTFSAASFIAANIKSDKRGLVIGTETGGAYNGTVAGQMPMIKLKKTKLLFRVGTINMKPADPKGAHGRGVMPDVELSSSVEDVLKGKDVEMEYVEKIIYKEK